MAPTINNTQAPAGSPTPTTSPSPIPTLKRKAVTTNDIFKPNKRPAYTLNKPTFGQEYQREQRKVQDELPMREDMLKGIIIPPKAIPNDVHSGFGGRSQQGDPAGMYRWVAQHGDSTRARRNKHITEAVRDRAAASFPMAEKRKEEGRKAKATEKTKFSKRIEYVVEGYRQLETGKKDCNIPWVKFMHRCWKELNYAATFGSGPLEHRDLKKYEEAFGKTFDSIFDKKNAQFLVPRWSKDKGRGCSVMEWEYLRN